MEKRKAELRKAVNSLRQRCDVVASAPMAFFLAGEHAVVIGAPSIVVTIPRRVYVGVKHKVERVNANHGLQIRQLLVFNAQANKLDVIETATLQQYENLAKMAERVRQSRLAQTEWVPSEIYIVSDGFPGRGCNFSGAFATALQACIACLNGWMSKRGPDWRGHSIVDQIGMPSFQLAFQIAMIVETLAHQRPSGYGPASSLLDLPDQPMVYFPDVSRPDQFFGDSTLDEVKQFTTIPWSHFASESVLNRGHAANSLGVLVIDTGVYKATHQRIAQLRQTAIEIDKFWTAKLEDWYSRSSGADRCSKVLANPFTRALYSPYLAISALSAQALFKLVNLASSRTEQGLRDFLAIVRALDEVHRSGGLDWERYQELREDIGRIIDNPEKWATKLTGGGGGGCVVILAKVRDIQKIRAGLKRKWGVLFDSLSERPEKSGIRIEKFTQTDNVRLQNSMNARIEIREIGQSAGAKFGPGPAVETYQQLFDYVRNSNGT